MQIEVSVIMFREDLEDKGLSKEDSEQQVAEHRAKLVAAAEKVPVKEGDGGSSRSSKRKRAPDKAKEEGGKQKEREPDKSSR